jgi:hypothetical protein
VSPSERRGLDRRNSRLRVLQDRRRSERRHGERRSANRIPLELWMEEVFADDVYFRRTGNVSSGGAYFDRALPHAVGTVVTLKFTLPGEQEMVVARGEVVNAGQNNAGLGMSVKFISFECNGQQRVEHYLLNQSDLS